MRFLPVFLTLQLCLCSFVSAEINPYTGEFLLSHIDLQTKEYLYPFKIIRNYNHRIKSSGIFGNNWCSNFEETVVHSSKGAEVKLCNQNTQGLYAKTGHYFANSTGTELVKPLPKNKGYIRLTPEYIYTYRANGQLFSIALKKNYEKPFLKIFYTTDNLIEKIVYNNKHHYLFSFDKDKKLVNRIQGPNGVDLTYTYDDKNNLITALNAWKKPISYAYDDKSRITSITLPDGARNLIYYDSKQNMVTRVEDAQGCISSINYRVNMQTTTILSQHNNTCEKTSSTFTSKRSPIFYKNRNNKQFFMRKPASVSKEMVDTSRGWKRISDGRHQWDYYENDVGNITQIKETDFKQNKIQMITAKYTSQKLTQLKYEDESIITFKYNKNKIVGMTTENGDDNKDENKHDYTAFKIFSRFLLAKAGAN